MSTPSKSSAAAPPDPRVGPDDDTTLPAPGPSTGPETEASPLPRISARPTRVALVGAGYIAAYHLEVLARTPDVLVTCIVDQDLERARDLARRFAIPLAVSDLAELPEPAPDVAHVLVPPDAHGAVCRTLLERGVGVLCEKPLALSSLEAHELEHLARARGVALGVNHNALHHPAFVRLRAALERGDVGRLQHVHVTFSLPLRQLDAGDFSHWMFREPRNIVFEQAPHPYSQLVQLVGAVQEADVTLLESRELQPGQTFHGRWSVAARAEHGTASVQFAFGSPFPRSTLTVLGTDGFLEADLHHDLFQEERKTKWLDFWNSFLAGWRRGGQLRRGALRGLLLWTRQTLGLGPRADAFYAGMRDSIRAFHASVRAGRRPAADGEHAARVLEWCERTVADVERPRGAPAPSFESRSPRPGEVCVLGANGFIGRALVRRLREARLPVTGGVRRNRGLPDEILRAADPGDLRLVRARLEDPDALAAAVRGARCVVHLATGNGDSWEDVERSMVRGSLAVAEACEAEQVDRLVFVSSTAALYLGPEAGEVLEDSLAVDPRPEVRPPYARGKAEAELALRRFCEGRRLELVIVRPAVVLGPGTPFQHSGLGLWVRDNHCVGWGRGTRPVPIVDVEDVAEALCRVVSHRGNELAGRALNLASASELTAAEIVAHLRERTGRALSFHGRPLVLSQLLELGKWVVKRVGGRRVPLPGWRDLKSRSLHPRLSCRTARELLEWTPEDDGRAILDRMLGHVPPDAER